MSKKIIINVPDWYAGRNIYVFFGRECYMSVGKDGKSHTKITRCTRCGLCCQNPGKMFPVYVPEGETEQYCAYCEKDGDEWICNNPVIPYGCLRETPGTLPHPDCPMKHEVTDGLLGMR